eukprot:4862243-Prorocentrum_lima.AAC.1
MLSPRGLPHPGGGRRAFKGGYRRGPLTAHVLARVPALDDAEPPSSRAPLARRSSFFSTLHAPGRLCDQRADTACTVANLRLR